MHAYLADDFVHGGAVGGTGAGDWPRSDWKALMDGEGRRSVRSRGREREVVLGLASDGPPKGLCGGVGGLPQKAQLLDLWYKMIFCWAYNIFNKIFTLYLILVEMVRACGTCIKSNDLV